jgi:TetR/AcrR family transcriptional repressor of nem operon
MKTKQDTRELLLDSAFKTFYKQGYQGANIATLLKEVGINKGSMYHFFKSKKELGLYVIEERIKRNLLLKYEKVLAEDACFSQLFNTLKDAPSALVYGCPLNKMSQEMLYIDEDFKKSLSLVYRFFEDVVSDILKNAIHNKLILRCDTKTTARLIITTYEGALMVYHLNQDITAYHDSLEMLQIQIKRGN